MNIWDEIKESFKTGSNLVKLIYINLGVFLLIKVFHVFLFLMNIDQNTFSLVDWLAVPASLFHLVYKPWALFTYMFLHESFLHILFNMLWLFWFGKIFLLFLSEKKLLSVYLLGGLTGAGFYILAYNIFPAFEPVVEISSALGASASVMAIVWGAVTISPNFAVQIPFIGPIKIKWIALIFTLMDIMQIPLGNAGGHIAHLGGAVLGYYYVSQDQKGKTVGRWFDRLMDRLFSFLKGKSKMKVTHRQPVNKMDDLDYNAMKAQKQTRIDQILDKISKSGYDSLSKEEKDILFNMSNKK